MKALAEFRVERSVEMMSYLWSTDRIACDCFNNNLPFILSESARILGYYPTKSQFQKDLNFTFNSLNSFHG